MFEIFKNSVKSDTAVLTEYFTNRFYQLEEEKMKLYQDRERTFKIAQDIIKRYGNEPLHEFYQKIGNPQT